MHQGAAIVSIAIPISVVATFNLMYFNGLTLNMMTLGGLALGAGMLVDNAIVVMENIIRNLEAGRRLRESMARYCAEFQSAVLSMRVVTPAFLFRRDECMSLEASRTVVLSTWAGVLLGVDLADFAKLAKYWQCPFE